MRDRLSAFRRGLRVATPALALGTAALTATLAACSDAPMGPRPGPSAAPGAANRAPAPPPPAEMLEALGVHTAANTTAGGPVRDVAPLGFVTGAGVAVSQTTRGDTAVMVVTFDPTVAHTITFMTRPNGGGMNANGVVLGASSVCALTSGYGPAYWDAPCAAATKPFTLTIKGWQGSDKRPAITFSPDLRFTPGSANWLWMADAAPSSKGFGAVVWCPGFGQACVDEGAYDSLLATGYAQGVYYRRIKHFSGYTVIVSRNGGLQ